MNIILEKEKSLQICSVLTNIESWYKEIGRSLPWREDKNPYKIWISEIMLQQTRIEAVKPYYDRFIHKYPNIKALSEAKDDELNKYWEGLGYYARVINQKKTAVQCVEKYEGELPKDVKQLLALPGIGAYTAGAIASIAYETPIPAVDGNVLRVWARLMADNRDVLLPGTKKEVEAILISAFRQLYESYQNDISYGAINAGLMELGELICLPKGKINCNQCPVECYCKANALNIVETLPVRIAKKEKKIEEYTIFVIMNPEGRIWIHKRPNRGLLADLYEFPNTSGNLKLKEAQDYIAVVLPKTEIVEEMGEASHIFTHKKWNMTGYLCLTTNYEDKPDQWLLVSADELKEQYAIPSAFSAYYQKLYLNRNTVKV